MIDVGVDEVAVTSVGADGTAAWAGVESARGNAQAAAIAITRLRQLTDASLAASPVPVTLEGARFTRQFLASL